MSRTELSIDDMRRILRPLGLAPTAVVPIDKGTVNSNFRVDTDGGALFVRVNEGKRVEDVRYEGELLWHLGARRFPTPQPLRTSAGLPYLVDGEHLITVFPWQPGEEIPEQAITAAHAGRVGDLLARLHLAAADFPRQRRGIYTFERICDRIERLRGRASDVPEIADALPTLDDEVAWLEGARSGLATLPSGTIHGDLFPDNLMWVSDRIAAALDFEQACRGRYVYDLAVTLLAFCWRSTAALPAAGSGSAEGSGALVEGLAWSLVSGYQRMRPLSEGEREALWVEARSAALRFTVTRITDVLLPSLPPESRPPRSGKDHREFLARLRHLRDAGADELLPIMGERPPLRAV